MADIYSQVANFKAKYPMTIGWRYRRHADVILRHLNPGEYVQYAFVAQKNDNPFNIWESAVVALTNERILIGRKRIVIGYFLNSITPDLFNDMQVTGGILWGKVHIDTVKEFITLSNIANNALPEIETEVSSFMIAQKKKYYQGKKREEDF